MRFVLQRVDASMLHARELPTPTLAPCIPYAARAAGRTSVGRSHHASFIIIAFMPVADIGARAATT